MPDPILSPSLISDPIRSRYSGSVPTHTDPIGELIGGGGRYSSQGIWPGIMLIDGEQIDPEVRQELEQMELGMLRDVRWKHLHEVRSYSERYGIEPAWWVVTPEGSPKSGERMILDRLRQIRTIQLNARRALELIVEDVPGDAVANTDIATALRDGVRLYAQLGDTEVASELLSVERSWSQDDSFVRQRAAESYWVMRLGSRIDDGSEELLRGLAEFVVARALDTDSQESASERIREFYGHNQGDPERIMLDPRVLAGAARRIHKVDPVIGEGIGRLAQDLSQGIELAGGSTWFDFRRWQAGLDHNFDALAADAARKRGIDPKKWIAPMRAMQPGPFRDTVGAATKFMTPYTEATAFPLSWGSTAGDVFTLHEREADIEERRAALHRIPQKLGAPFNTLLFGSKPPVRYGEAHKESVRELGRMLDDAFGSDNLDPAKIQRAARYMRSRPENISAWTEMVPLTAINFLAPVGAASAAMRGYKAVAAGIAGAQAMHALPMTPDQLALSGLSLSITRLPIMSRFLRNPVTSHPNVAGYAAELIAPTSVDILRMREATRDPESE